jgi:hypothetical protein
MNVARLVAPLVVLCLATGGMFAQTPALNTQKNNAAPAGFRATVGAQMPSGVVLVPVPAAIADVMPQTKGLETAMVEGELLLVDGQTIVAVIALEL